METKRRFVKIGFLIGLGASLAVFVVGWASTAEGYYNQKVFYYEAYLFWQKCKQEGKSDIQAATERFRIIHNQPNFRPENHPDVKHGHPEAFIRGTLGYELWNGFGYGKEPGRLETLFEWNTIRDTLCFMVMLWPIGFTVLVAPFLGAIIGYTLEKRRYSKSERS